VKDKLFIRTVAEHRGTHFELYDLLGKCLKCGVIGHENFSLELNDLAPGIYVLNLGDQVFKFIKSRD
jgi:uncharacterized surface anchored protein